MAGIGAVLRILSGFNSGRVVEVIQYARELRDSAPAGAKLSLMPDTLRNVLRVTDYSDRAQCKAALEQWCTEQANGLQTLLVRESGVSYVDIIAMYRLLVITEDVAQVLEASRDDPGVEGRAQAEEILTQLIKRRGLDWSEEQLYGMVKDNEVVMSALAVLIMATQEAKRKGCA